MASAPRRLAKRACDVLVAGAALLALAPLIALVAVAIKLAGGGVVVFAQDRVGKGGRVFRCYKFCTMIAGAEAMGHTVTLDDPRITRVGRLLRLWTLDEIPQLVNVLKGEMSLVGPRPWVPAQVASLPPSARRRSDVRPGMAGWAWIHGRNLLPWDERIRLDLWYVDHWSLSLDLSILARGALQLLLRTGVYSADLAGRVGEIRVGGRAGEAGQHA